jgi:hypothetical protein
MISKALQEKFDSYPKHVRPKMDALRSLILDVASMTNGAGEIEETLKWGEPSYLTSETKSGSTIRIDWVPKSPEQYAIFFNCKTTLVDSYGTMFPDAFTLAGNRAIIFSIDDAIPEKELSVCIGMALRYHLDKLSH